MVIAADSNLLTEVLREPIKGARELLIRNYAFGWDGDSPKHEIDLKIQYVVRDSRASVLRIEADNGRSKPCFEKIWLPEAVVNELEAECTADYRDQMAGDEA
jgi:hypothetical protein